MLRKERSNTSQDCCLQTMETYSGSIKQKNNLLEENWIVHRPTWKTTGAVENRN